MDAEERGTLGLPTSPGDRRGCRGGRLSLTSDFRGNVRPCILLWDAGIWELPVPPPISPSRVLLAAIFGVLVPSSLGAPQPDLSLGWAYLGAPPACHAQGRAQSCANLQEGQRPPCSHLSWQGVSGGGRAAAPVTSCFAPSLLTETKGEDATATQCQDADHQAAPSRQGGPCYRECRP